MNDRELDLALDRLGVEHVRRSAPSTLRDRVHVVPLEIKRRPWLLPFPAWRFGSMFSATKYVVAGAIVALFGGFLLAGVLTQQDGEVLPAAVTESPSLMTTEELLSGMATEEVEPGVYRVLSDAAGHDLVAEPPAGVTVAPDGSIWLLRASDDLVDGSAVEPNGGVDSVFQLGQDGTYRFEPSSSDFVDLAVDTDGAAWVSIGSEPQDGRWGYSGVQGSLASVDEGTWAFPTWPDGSTDVGAIEATSDGAVWVARNVEDGPGPSVARLKDGEWTVLPTLDDPSLEGHYRGQFANFVVADDGTAWLANGRMTWGGDGAPGPTGLLHFDGERWEVVDLPVEGRIHAGPLALGPDGTLWVYAMDMLADVPSQNYLLRLDADGWTLYAGRSGARGLTLDEADGVPMLSTQFYYEARMAVDPDGRLWIAVSGDGGEGNTDNWLYPPSLEPAPGPVGVLTFDGTTWNQHLKGYHVNRVDVAEDGTVLATVLYGCPTRHCSRYNSEADWNLGGLYVITPEAVAATE